VPKTTCRAERCLAAGNAWREQHRGALRSAAASSCTLARPLAARIAAAVMCGRVAAV
jgi:hypothetical protein